MIAAAAALAIFAYCTIVGLAVVATLGSEDRPYLPLLAPAIGAAIIIIPGIWISELGVPMARAGPIELIAISVVAIVAIVRARRRIHLARYWPFGVILLAAFIASAWPIFQFGFNWLSYSNDDMSNYVLNAERLVELGWFSVPDFTAYNFNRDPTAIYWLWTVDNERFGAEMFLTTWLSVFRVNGFQLFMPVMAALGMMQIAAAAALVYRTDARRNQALWVAALMAICALATFGLEYQLLAQVFGIGQLIAAIVLLCDLPERVDWRRVLLAGIATTGVSMVYPEVTPFLVLGVAVYFGVLLYRRALTWRGSGLWIALVALATTLLLNAYLRNYLAVVWRRVLSNSGSPTDAHVRTYIELFPFYLLPSGLPTFYGLYSAVEGISEPWLSLGILGGAILLVATIVVVLRAVARAEPAAPVALAMLGLGGLLFWSRNGFGLFKLAMYVQPFLIACFVPRLSVWLGKYKPAVIAALLLYAILNVQTQAFYVDRSRAGWSAKGTTFVEIPNASASHLLDELGHLSTIANPSVDFISDTTNVVFGKIEAFFAKPSNIVYPSSNFLPGVFILTDDRVERALMIPKLVDIALSMRAQRRRNFKSPNFIFKDDYGLDRLNAFFSNSSIPALERRRTGVIFLEDTAAQSVVNRWYTSDVDRNFNIVPIDRVKNHLIFVSSRYGLDYYSRGRSVALYQLEPDLFYNKKTMAGMGRRILFEIVNPTPKIHLEINYTATLKDDGQCVLYDPSILGAGMRPRYGHVIGRGSARVFLPVVTPRVLVGQPYMMLDMNTTPTLFPFPRTGLMNLYGRNIPLDGRLLVGFVRDISAVTDEEYQRLNRPSFLNNLRADLANRNLEYSGAYEDGWISESSEYVLARPAEKPALVVSGLVPLIGNPNFHTTLRVLADNREVGRAELGIGAFRFQFPAKRLGSRARVTLLFDRYQRLPNGDGRPVAAQLYTVGFLTAQQAAAQSGPVMTASRTRSAWFSASANSRIEFGSGWYPLETYGGQTFRWANNDARLVVRASTTQNSKLVVDVAPGPGEGSKAGALHLVDSAGRDLGAARIARRRSVVFPLKAAAGPETYVLHIDRGGASIPSDPRILNFRVFGISLK